MTSQQTSRPLCPQDVVAFLQNPWFKPETKAETIEKYRTDHNFRRRLLLGTQTGERLFRAFGDEWYTGIWWDNANQTHGTHWSQAYTADIEHMAGVIARRTPLMVITFGAISLKGWQRLLTVPGAGSYYKTIHHMKFPHPMAWGVTINQLEEFALRVQMTTLV